MAEPKPDYFLDHYGTCALKPCLCLHPKAVWLGRTCSNWTPAGFTSYAEMHAHVYPDDALRLHPRDDRLKPA